MNKPNWTPIKIRLGDIRAWEANPRMSTKAQANRIIESERKFNQVIPFIISPSNTLLDGHQRLAAWLTVYGEDHVMDAMQADRELSDAEHKELVITLHTGATGSWDWNIFANGWATVQELDAWGMGKETLDGWGKDYSNLKEMLGSEADTGGEATAPNKTLAERFGIPPFSILDARQGYWQKRKAAWIDLGIQSEIGRGESAGTRARADEPTYREIKNRKPNATPGGAPLPAARLENGHTVRGDGRGRRLTWVQGDREQLDETSGKNLAAGRKSHTSASSNAMELAEGFSDTHQSGTSIFDPVLCELAYLWFCPPLGQILDPFAGGSVRGIVASYLAYHYIGIDLRPEQIEANELQAARITPDNKPVWMQGDSRNLSKMLDTQFDFIFSCPPYFDLEVYSENEQDLSNAGEYGAFLEAYRDIIKQSVTMLKDDRFACFVVGDIRDKKGFYRNFPADTIAAFQDAGMTLYNEAILVTAVGSLPIRISKQFGSYRKLGKTHQNVLVFYKGNPKAIKDNFGEIEITDLAEQYGEIA